jgi:hypothetical protein
MKLPALVMLALAVGCASSSSRPGPLYRFGMPRAEAAAAGPCVATKDPQQLACPAAGLLDPARPLYLVFAPSGGLEQIVVVVAAEASWDDLRLRGREAFRILEDGLGGHVDVETVRLRRCA